MSEGRTYYERVVLTLSLVLVLGTAVIAQSDAEKCRQLGEDVRSRRIGKGEYTLMISVADRYDFYKDVLARVEAGAKAGLVVEGLGAVVQQLDQEVLDTPQVGGRPKLTIKELLAFQARLAKILPNIVYWAAELDTSDKFGKERYQLQKERLDAYSQRLTDTEAAFEKAGCPASSIPPTNPDDLAKITPKPEPKQQDSACKITGDWVQYASGVGASTWSVTADGTATEAGLGAAKGRATLSGRTMTIEWSHTNGWSGTYRWNMDAACKKGTGELIFKSGGSGTRSSSVTHN